MSPRPLCRRHCRRTWGSRAGAPGLSVQPGWAGADRAPPPLGAHPFPPQKGIRTCEGPAIVSLQVQETRRTGKRSRHGRVSVRGRGWPWAAPRRQAPAPPAAKGAPQGLSTASAPCPHASVSSWPGFARELGVRRQLPTASAWTFTSSPCARGSPAAEPFIRRLLHYLKKLISASWAGSQFVKGDCD